MFSSEMSGAPGTQQKALLQGDPEMPQQLLKELLRGLGKRE